MPTQYEMARNGKRSAHALRRDPPQATSANNEAGIDELAEQFFRHDSLRPVELDLSDASTEQAAPARRAMVAALSLLGGSSTLIGAFLIYSRVIMPVPIELGAPSGVETLSVPSAALVPSAPSAPRTPALLTASLVDPDEVAAPEAAAQDADPPPTAAEDVSLASAPTHAVDRANPEPVAPTAPTAEAQARRKQLQRDLVERAYGSLNRGDAPNALQLARQAVVEAPQRADAWIALGSAYYALHDRGNARAAFHNCVVRAEGPFVSQCRALAND